MFIANERHGSSSYCPKEEMVSVGSARYGEVAELILSHFRQWGADAEPENLLNPLGNAVPAEFYE